MTITQLIVLACLGLTTIGIIGFAARMILGSTKPLDVLEVRPTQDDQGTSIPLPTRTPFPTRTPLLPTPTFTATTYESLIPDGWKQLTYAKVELWVPADFESNSSSNTLIDVVNKSPDTSGFKININLTNEVVTVNDLDTYVQEGLTQLPHDVTYLERKKYAIGTYEAMRLKVQVIVMNMSVEEAIYLIKDGDTIWLITCASHFDEFHDWLPIFDQIARTFRISP